MLAALFPALVKQGLLRGMDLIHFQAVIFPGNPGARWLKGRPGGGVHLVC